MPPVGWTGKGAPFPDRATVDDWCRARPGGNVALRLPVDVVGIDLDLYKDEGRDSYAKLVAECGPLPAAWVSSARDDGSGIRFFAVPPGVRWAERLAGPGIELVHTGHRYAVVWPSIHPEGCTYRWRDPSGTFAGCVPAVAELTALPVGWGRRLSEQAATQPVRQSGNGGAPAVSAKLATASLAGAVAELSRLTVGQQRNEALNRKGYALGGYVAAGQLDQAQVRDQLFAACAASGYVARHGQRATLATIDAAMRAGMARPRGIR